MSETKDYSDSARSEAFFKRVDRIVNPRKLTIERVKSQKGLENLTDEQAREIIDGLYQFSLITYNIYMKELRKNENK